MEFTLSLTKEDIEMMLSREFGHDIQLNKFYFQEEGEDLPEIVDFDNNYSFMIFQCSNLIAPKQKFNYNDSRDYDMD
jgi:hypothetical protein